jgi:hypothetical protein
LELCDRVTVQQAGEDGKEIKAFTIKVDANREGEPASRSGDKGSLYFIITEFMNIMAEVFIDLNFPFGFSQHSCSLGSKPRPINRGSGKMGIWKPAAFY